jgi:hypothetical protein
MNRIKVRSTIGGGWVWELRTPDGHVAASSEVFGDREACEADARNQGLPVTGLRKGRRSKTKALATGLNIRHDSRGIWRWECVGEDGSVASASDIAFLTRDECARDAEERAPCITQATATD